jgi:hypothetical protein
MPSMGRTPALRRVRAATPLRLMTAIGIGMAAAAPGMAADKPAPAQRNSIKITGGDNVGAGEFTAVVALRQKINQQAFCTGTVVADFWVMTARHCLTNITANRLYISTGYDGSHGQSFQEQRRVLNDDHDVALIETTTQITSPTVTAASLSSARVSAGTTVTAVGWGLMYNNAPVPASKLQKVDLQIKSPCPTFPDMICASDPNGGHRGVAPYDSGGPIFAGDHARQIQVGSVVGAARDDIKTFYFVPSDDIRDWVQQTIR